MKRSGFKIKPRKPLKRGKLRRKSKSPTRKLQDALWEECRRIIKARYITATGKYYCFTCDKEISGSNCQLGHFIPKSVGGAALKYNLDNLRLQCYYDNINLGGNGSEFYKRLVAENGQEYIDKLFALKNETIPNANDYYQKLLEQYKLYAD